MKRRDMLGLVPLGMAASSAAAVEPLHGEGTSAHALGLEVGARWHADMRFLLHLPRGYDTSGSRAWPIVFFLHGSGERGEDIERVKLHGPPKLVDAHPEWAFILVSPQIGEDANWNSHELHALLDALKPRLRIDPARVSATGLSLGGHGVWAWATDYPHDLAAIAPVCGYGDALRVCRMKHVPVRAYHGADDTVVPLAMQQRMVDALRDCGGQANLTVYPGVGHDAWNPAYDDPELMRWLTSQKRRP